MKLKNIFITLSVAGLLFSCTSEEVIQSPIDPTVTPEEISFDVKVSLGSDIMTKALIGEEGNEYEWAKPSELIVTNCAIAVFDFDEKGDPNTLVGFKRITIGDTEKTSVNDTLAYQVSGVKARMGKVRILAVANSALTSDLDKFSDFATVVTPYTYTQFKALAETTDYSVAKFDPTTLVKMGEIDYTFTESNYKTAVVVPMEQLAARVDLKIAVDFERDLLDEYNEVLLSEEAAEFLRTSNLNNYNSPSKAFTIELENGQEITGYNCAKQDHCNETKESLYFNGKKLEGGNKWLHLSAALVNNTKAFSQWALHVNKITISNLQTKTDIILPYDPKISKNSFNKEFCNWGNNYEDVNIVDSLKITFYTYEKDLYKGDLSEAVTVSVDAELWFATVLTTKQYLVNRAVHTVWAKEDNNGVLQIADGNGSNGEKYVLCDLDKDYFDAIDESTPIVSEFSKTEDTKVYGKSFAFVINPAKTMPNCNTDGLIHGNIYTLGLTIDNIDLDYTLEYAVVPWNDDVIINIPPFN